MPSNALDYLTWLEHEAPWELTITEFYEQYEFSLKHVSFPSNFRRLVCSDTLTALRRYMSQHFGKSVDNHIEITAHKLTRGQTIRIHNDFISGGESHRLLVQINRSWKPNDGGYLMLFSEAEPESVRKLIKPINGSIQAFAISPKSYHAVSTVHSGERFTIVYSFYPA